jgi:type I restriction enzyme R subunit
MNPNPEQKARGKIDQMLKAAGWQVQANKKVNLSASQGVAVREYQTDVGPADYVLFIDKTPVGIIEAKRESEGQHLLQVAKQSGDYAHAKLKYLNNNPLPFIYESTGALTHFRDERDPKPKSRIVYSFHQPQTLANWLKKDQTLRAKLATPQTLNEDGLRKAQIKAIKNLETSFSKDRPRALVQMATGAGKTFTAATFMYRLLKNADAKRILFLVDTKNLGEQAEQELRAFGPNDDNRKFTELYNIQRLSSSYIATDSQICISTIQRMYSILKGEELDESAENNNPNENTWLQKQSNKKQALPVNYNAQIPIEHFDFIVIDECHRSIYNLWKQVLDYFDAYLIGLTATPDKRTFGFFNENVVSEYTYEESVIDGVNVPYDVYTIETKISQQGDTIKAGWYVDRRDKLTRKKRWQQEDEDTQYKKNDLDKKVVNPSQIRNIIREFKHALKTTIYPKRVEKDGTYQVPKTLVFAKTDSHADDIIKIILDEFGEGNEFCKKVTYKIDDNPKTILNQFRNSYYPRIAVTVDMIATGTDVKPLEVLLFMRDVKSINYFEQMKGRGTRTLPDDSLKLVSNTAQAKTHFVIVDAVGVIKSKKTDSRPLERQQGIPLKDLLGAITMGVAEEDLYLSLASRLIRLDKQITPKQQTTLQEHTGGKNLKQITKDLLNAYDPDTIQKHKTQNKCETTQQAQTQLQNIASNSFNGEMANYLDNVRKQLEQIIDSVNIDTIIKSEWNTTTHDNAQQLITDFKTYIEQNKDEIQALSIYYNQPNNRRHITFKMCQEILEILELNKPKLAPLNVWQAYETLGKVKNQTPKNELSALIALIRKVSGIDKNLKPFDKTIDDNFKKWIFNQNAGQHNRFNKNQMDWLRMLKQHVINSCHIELNDLDYTPFNAQGGIGKMHQLFGDEMQNIIDELNEVLVA